MSEFSTNDEHGKELPDVRVEEDNSSSTCSETVSTDAESLDSITTQNTSIATLPHNGDDTRALDLRTSPGQDKNPLLVDIVAPSTALPTRNDNLNGTEQTIASSVISDPPMILTSDDQSKPSVSFPTGNDDSSAPDILSTISLQQFPVSILCNIAGELSNAKHDGDSLDTSANSETGVHQAQLATTSKTYRQPHFHCRTMWDSHMQWEHRAARITSRNSRTVVQARRTTAKTYRQQLLFQSRSMWDSRTQWEHHAAGIQPSTSQAVNVIYQPNTTIFGDPRCNKPGSRSYVSQPYRPRFVGTPSKCSGNMKPGVVRLDRLYDTYTGEEVYGCVLCGCQVTSENGLERHRRNMHFIFKINDPDSGEGMYKCRCGCQFRLQEFHEHIRNIHKDHGELRQLCNVCQRRFHTGEKPFKCEECPFERSFWHARDLEWHYRIHKNDAPFKCYSCGKGFWQKYLLAIHIPA